MGELMSHMVRGIQGHSLSALGIKILLITWVDYYHFAYLFRHPYDWNLAQGRNIRLVSSYMFCITHTSNALSPWVGEGPPSLCKPHCWRRSKLFIKVQDVNSFQHC